jgi:SET domain-containing protein
VQVPDEFEIKFDEKKGTCLIAKRSFKKGDIIIKESGIIIKSRRDSSTNAVQVGPDRFADIAFSSFTECINHSCEPNTKYDVDRFEFIAIKNIKIGDEITFHYLSTDWDLQVEGLDFDCHCGSNKCLRRISGYKFLSPTQQKKINPKPKN